MLTPLTNPDPALFAPLAMLQLAYQDFPKTIRQTMADAARNREEDGTGWTAATYIPVCHLKTVIDDAGEARSMPANLADNLAATLAVTLVWAQSREVVEVSRHAYYQAIANSNPLRALPVDRLTNLARTCICFTTPSLRLSEGGNSPQLLTVFGCVDEVLTPAGKWVPELALAYLYNHPAERQFATKVARIPLSEGLSFKDAIRRSKRSSSIAPQRSPKFAGHGSWSPGLIEDQEVLQLTIFLNMLLLVSDDLRARENSFSAVPANDRGLNHLALTVLELDRPINSKASI